MALISYGIQLTSAPVNSGPQYAVSYSTNCTTYTYAGLIDLPASSSIAYVDIEETSTCIKLSSTGNCTNEVVSGSTPSASDYNTHLVVLTQKNGSGPEFAVSETTSSLFTNIDTIELPAQGSSAIIEPSEDAIAIRLTSLGTCTNSLTKPITPSGPTPTPAPVTPTPTPTVSPTPTPTPSPTPQPGLLWYKLEACNLGPANDCYTYIQPSIASQRYADYSQNPIVFYEWDNVAPLSSDQGIPCPNIQIVPNQSGCPTIQPTPTPTPAPSTQNVEIRDCNGTQVWYVQLTNASQFPNGFALKLTSSGGTLDGSKCWEIINNNYQGQIDFQVTVDEVNLDCDNCIPSTEPTPTPSPTPTPQPTPVPPIYYARFITCNEPAGAILQVQSPSPIPTNVVLLDGNDCYEYNNIGGVGADGDISTFTQFSNCTDCANRPTPTPVPTATPAPSCFAVQLEGPLPNSQFVCDNYVTYYTDTNNFCTASTLVRQSDCTRSALAGWYNDQTTFSFRYWNGSAFTTACDLTACP